MLAKRIYNYVNGSDCTEKVKNENHFVSKLSIQAKNRLYASGDSHVDRHQVGQQLCFEPKHVPSQIKLRFLELSINTGQSNFMIIFIFVSCQEKRLDCSLVVLEGQLGTAARNASAAISFKDARYGIENFRLLVSILRRSWICTTTDHTKLTEFRIGFAESFFVLLVCLPSWHTSCFCTCILPKNS